MQANGIDDVLRILDGIIADTKAKSDPLGYFPALYRHTESKDVPAIIDALSSIVPATGAPLP